MKKFLAILLIIALLTGIAASAAAEGKAELPKQGETVCGFTLKTIRDFPLVDGKILYFEHDKTGAGLVYIANNDINRAFDLTFFTVAMDNTGLPHVFEHAVLDGSEKYPSRSLFFNLYYQTYNTYMNAATGPNYTTYPVSSLSEAQLLKYADYYTDSCLHPCILEDESIFLEEGWRYRLENMEDPLSIEGTVYSEMCSSSSLNQNSYYNMLRTAFPGSYSGNIAGGDPASIPEMSWEMLKAYHSQFYHPSNCVAYLYGEFEDYTAFLQLLDEAFSAYDRREFSSEDLGYTPINGDVEMQFSFPVEVDSYTENGTDLYYVFLCPGLKDDPREELYLNTLTDLMASEASPVSRKLAEVLPAAFMSTWIELNAPEDAIVFNISGINSEDAETAREAIDAGLQEIAENGFRQELVDSMTAALNMNMLLSRENTAMGIALITGNLMPYYAARHRVFDYLEYVDGLQQIDEWNQSGVYRRVVSKWLLNCKSHALTTTVPEPGLREELDAAEVQRLEEVKASMSEEQLQAIIDRVNAPNTSDDASEYVAQLQALTVQSLPEETPEYDIREETDQNGIRRVTARAGVSGVCMPVVLLDAAGVAQEDLHWFVLYLYTLGQLDTAEHSKEEFQDLSSRYLYGANIRQSLVDSYGTKDYHPYLRAGWISSDKDLEKGYELLYELLFETQFDNIEDLAGIIEQNKIGLKNMINSSAYNTMRYRLLGAETPMYAYYSYCTGLEFYEFLKQVQELIQTAPEEVTRKLNEIRDSFHNSTNAISIYAGDTTLVGRNRIFSNRFFAKLDQRPVEPVKYAFEEPGRWEAIVVDDTMQYNGVVGSFETLGIEKYTGDLDAVAAVVSDLYLIPMLRETYGVYTPLHYYDSFSGAYMISYQDPNIKETFEVYEALPDLLENEKLDQETLDGYILSVYSMYAMPEGELSGAITAAMSYLSGEPGDLKVQHMEALKSLTPEMVQGYASIYRNLAESGRRFTVGSASAIRESEQLYDVILRPFAGEE